jgi:hypothetical protein
MFIINENEQRKFFILFYHGQLYCHFLRHCHADVPATENKNIVQFILYVCILSYEFLYFMYILIIMYTYTANACMCEKHCIIYCSSLYLSNTKCWHYEKHTLLYLLYYLLMQFNINNKLHIYNKYIIYDTNYLH